LAIPFDHQLASYYVEVHRAALGWLGEEQEAREAAQEALLKAWRARASYDPARPFAPWLFQIVKHTCFDAAARRRHRAVPGLEPERVADGSRSAADGLEQAQSDRRVQAALRALSDEHREILNMRHFRELSYAEIAAELGIPEGTVMSRLYRARRALVAALGGGGA
jgi:RNA polymerase sigma-70 factor (ECF subfamily)